MVVKDINFDSVASSGVRSSTLFMHGRWPAAADKKIPPVSSKGKPESKDKKNVKDAKGGKPGKEGKELGGKGSKTPVSGKKVKDPSQDSQPSKITIASAGSLSGPFQEEDPILEAKYKEKLTTQAYQLLLQMADKIATSFEELEVEAPASK
ncbi:hypothetical protein NP493_182g04040 [Ridgeia piscesae]|uniref:Uncharacterized protein n=1 Tax=Ridgeia piscesae TaxID=27915 RepID=A0AAD9UF25_RIDPI|nr:hypothetical protein NP493_182g04040 [Ridgeia piscesae]